MCSGLDFALRTFDSHRYIYTCSCTVAFIAVRVHVIRLGLKFTFSLEFSEVLSEIKSMLMTKLVRIGVQVHAVIDLLVLCM